MFAALRSVPAAAGTERTFRESRGLPVLASFEQPPLETASFQVQNLKVAAGHSEFILQEGSAARI